MTNLFPPVLDDRARSIPYVNNPEKFMLVDFDKEELKIPHFDIHIKMPDMNSRKLISHMQISIKEQGTMETAVNTDLSPDKAVLYISLDTDNPVYANGNPYFRDDGDGYYTIRLNYGLFQSFNNGGRKIGPDAGKTYMVQVRFGSGPLWQDAGTGLNPQSFGKFSLWRQGEVTRVPSGFGEWSNIQKVYCYAGMQNDMDYKFDDFMPTICWQYKPLGEDPVEQVRLFYYYQGMEGQISKSQVFNGVYSNDNIFSLIEQLPVAPMVPIKVVLQAVTKNNTIVDNSIDIPPITFAWDCKPIPKATLEDVDLAVEEQEDGIIAKSIVYPLEKGRSETFKVYRANMYTLECIKLMDKKCEGPLQKLQYRDYTVEMGEDYMYIVMTPSTETDAGTVVGHFVGGLEWNYNSHGYARLTRMESTFLTSKKHQLRLSGNVTISGFKRNTSDQFQKTIGSKYPFYSRSAQNNYRTFQLGGLVTIQFDPTHSFMRLDPENGLFWDGDSGSSLKVLNRDIFKDTEISLSRRRIQDYENKKNEKLVDLGLPPNTRLMNSIERPALTADPSLRYEYPPDEKLLGTHTLEDAWGPKTVYDRHLYKDHVENFSTEPTDEMIFIERKFREAAMEWLSDGKPKLFRSETEGNMIVCVTNATFTPYQSKRRMVYQFTATLTEVADFSLDSLKDYNLVPSEIRYYFDPNLGYDFIPGDLDPNADNGLIFYYDPEMDVPNCIVGELIPNIDTSPHVANLEGIPQFAAAGLPNDLVIDRNTGVISGSPKVANIKDMRDPDAQLPRKATLTVTDTKTNQSAAVEINLGYFYDRLETTGNKIRIPESTVGVPIVPIEIEPFVVGGVKPYYYSGRNLPSGLGVNKANGTLTGSFATSYAMKGESSILVRDAVGQMISIPVVYDPAFMPLTFQDRFSLPENEVGIEIAEVDFKSGVMGGTEPYLFSWNPKISGLTLDENTGILSGTPDAVYETGGSTKVTVTDAKGERRSIDVVYMPIYPHFEFAIAPVLEIPKDGKPMNVGTTLEGLNANSYDAGGGVTGYRVTGGKPPYVFYSTGGLFPDFDIDVDGNIFGQAQVGNEKERYANITVSDARGKTLSYYSSKTQPGMRIAPIVQRLKLFPNDKYRLPEVMIGNVPDDYGFIIDLDTGSDGGTGPMTLELQGLNNPGITLDSIPEEPAPGVPVKKYILHVKPENLAKLVPMKARTGTLVLKDASNPSMTSTVSFPVGEVYAPLKWIPDGSTEGNVKGIDIPQITTNRDIPTIQFSGITGGKPPYSFYIDPMDGISPYKLISPVSGFFPNSAYIAGNSGKTPSLDVIRGNIVVKDSMTPPNTAALGFIRREIIEGLGIKPDQKEDYKNAVLVAGRSEIPQGSKVHLALGVYGAMSATGKLANYEFYNRVAGNKELGNGFFIHQDTVPGHPDLFQAQAYIYGKPINAKSETELNGTVKVRQRVNPDAAEQPIYEEASVGPSDRLFIPRVYEDITPMMSKDAAGNYVYSFGHVKTHQLLVSQPLFKYNPMPGLEICNEPYPDLGTFEWDKTSVKAQFTKPSETPVEIKVGLRRNASLYTPELQQMVIVRFESVAESTFLLNLVKLGTIPGLPVNVAISNIDIGGCLSGGIAPFTWNEAEVNNALPTGLKLAVNDGGRYCQITGTPTAQCDRKDITFVVKDSAGNEASGTLTMLGIYPKLVIDTSKTFNIPQVQKGTTIASLELSTAVSGGIPGPNGYTYSDINNQLVPYGYKVNLTTGQVSGTALAKSLDPTNAEIQVTDSKGQTGKIMVHVGGIIGNVAFNVPTNTKIPKGKVNTPINTLDFKLWLKGGVGPFRYNIPNQAELEKLGWQLTFENGVLKGTRPGTVCPAGVIQLLVTDSKDETYDQYELHYEEVTA